MQIPLQLVRELCMENTTLSVKFGLCFCTRLVFFYGEQFKISIPFVDSTSGLTSWSYSLRASIFCAARLQTLAVQKITCKEDTLFFVNQQRYK